MRKKLVISLPSSIATALAVACLLVVNLAFVPGVSAQQTEVLQEQFDEITATFKEGVEEAEKDQKKIRKLRAEASTKLLELADECDDAELAVSMLRWVVQQNSNNRKSKKALEIVVDQYIDQPGIANLFTEKTSADILEKAMEANEDPDVRAVIRYLNAMADEDEKTREETLIDLRDNHGDTMYRGQKLAKLAAGPLKMAAFQIGKVAPDITGPDIDGVDFSLSDYRGKVVMIDFWGDW